PDNTLWNYAAPTLSKEYLALINGFGPGPDVGSCGTAIHCDRIVIVSDIQNDPLWKDFKDIAAKFGLKACWSVPIHDSKGKILGAFGIYHYSSKAPNELMLRTIERLASLIGLLIENSEIVEDLRLSNERYELAAQATHDMIWDWDLQKNQIFRSEEGLRNIYGFATNDPIKHIDNWVERIHPDDRTRVRHAIEAIYYGRTDTVFHAEYRFLRGDGEYVHIYDRGYIMRDQKGDPIRVIGAAQDITERVMLQDQLSGERNARQEEIMKATIGVQEKERNEIGNELHDNVNQILTSAKLYIECVGLYDDEKESYRKTGVELIVTAIEEIRRLSRSLVPPRLKDVGLIKSIGDILDNISVTSGIAVDLCLEDFDEMKLEHGLKLAIYRIIQEQTTNILKHAKASQVRLQFTQKSNFLVLKITDDGKGFDLAHLTKGIGFTNIINRSAVYHGRVKIESSPGKGCSLTISFGPSGLPAS
ncbi:MAG TPA: PAS domain-containing protein, partial [Puia sp.]|nr:PAS domain-containing protein [Puia sp.]